MELEDIINDEFELLKGKIIIITQFVLVTNKLSRVNHVELLESIIKNINKEE